MQKTVTSTDNREVAGSSPASLTGIAQLGEHQIVCFRISLFVIQKSVYCRIQLLRLVRTFAIMVRVYGFESRSAVFDFITLYYIFMAAVQKTGSSCCRFKSDFSLFEDSSTGRADTSIMLTVFEFLCCFLLSYSPSLKTSALLPYITAFVSVTLTISLSVLYTTVCVTIFGSDFKSMLICI